MLQRIDTAIAFAAVMLMLSLIVMAIVQMVSARPIFAAGNLASGLENLVRQIEPEFRKQLHQVPSTMQQTQTSSPDQQTHGPTIAQHIAETVVRHPAIAHAGTRAKAVSQSDLIRVLRDLCSDHPAATLDGTAKEKLKNLLDARVPGGTDKLAFATIRRESDGSAYILGDCGSVDGRDAVRLPGAGASSDARGSTDCAAARLTAGTGEKSGETQKSGCTG
jgi:hypothetical protein